MTNIPLRELASGLNAPPTRTLSGDIAKRNQDRTSDIQIYIHPQPTYPFQVISVMILLL